MSALPSKTGSSLEWVADSHLAVIVIVIRNNPTRAALAIRVDGLPGRGLSARTVREPRAHTERRCVISENVKGC